MSDQTTIEWTDATWNPTRGCSRVSPGCVNCYAERVAIRFSGTGQPYEGLVRMVNGKPTWTGTMRLVPDMLMAPLGWKKPRMIFVDSMSDLFHAGVPFEYIDKVFAIMAMCQQHTFQVLTKRADRMLEYVTSRRAVIIHEAAKGLLGYDNPKRRAVNDWPLRNVWKGVSTENQDAADERVPLLLSTPAAVRWVSAEPLLAPLNLVRYLEGHAEHGIDWRRPVGQKVGACIGWTPPLDWVVSGGESGPGARPSHPDWHRSLRDQCAEAGVPYLFKQWGEWAPWNCNDGLGPWRYGEGHFADWVKPIEGLSPPTFTPFMDYRNNSIAGGQTIAARLGKKAAGRLLDGVEHNGFPEVRS